MAPYLLQDNKIGWETVGQLSTVVQALSVHTTVYLMGDLKQESSCAKELSILWCGAVVRFPTLQNCHKD